MQAAPPSPPISHASCSVSWEPLMMSKEGQLCYTLKVSLGEIESAYFFISWVNPAFMTNLLSSFGVHLQISPDPQSV